MEFNSDKSKILVNSIKPRPSTNVQMNGQKLEEVDQFKYLGCTQSKDGTPNTSKISKHWRKPTQP